jgi:hypothetical protein
MVTDVTCSYRSISFTGRITVNIYLQWYSIRTIVCHFVYVQMCDGRFNERCNQLMDVPILMIDKTIFDRLIAWLVRFDNAYTHMYRRWLLFYIFKLSTSNFLLFINKTKRNIVTYQQRNGHITDEEHTHINVSISSTTIDNTTWSSRHALVLLIVSIVYIQCKPMTSTDPMSTNTSSSGRSRSFDTNMFTFQW